MAKSYESAYAVCPFYKHEKYTSIYCEGLVDGVNTCHTFPSAGAYKAHREKYCYTMECESCPHNVALTRAYKEREDE